MSSLEKSRAMRPSVGVKLDNFLHVEKQDVASEPDRRRVGVVVLIGPRTGREAGDTIMVLSPESLRRGRDWAGAAGSQVVRARRRAPDSPP